MLKTETYSSRIERAILAASRQHQATSGLVDPTPVFEHGQWWVVGFDAEDDRVIYSAHDAEGPGSVDGFDFELMP